MIDERLSSSALTSRLRSPRRPVPDRCGRMDEPAAMKCSPAAEMFEDDARGHSRFGFRSADAQPTTPSRCHRS